MGQIKTSRQSDSKNHQDETQKETPVTKENNRETADTAKAKDMTLRDTSYQKPINLSNKELEKSEIDLMVKGPSFVPHRHIDRLDLRLAIDKSKSKLRW